jgi:hypothetical protein
VIIRENPVLFPASHDRAGHRTNPPTLAVLETEVHFMADRLAGVLLEAGFIYPKEDLVRAHAVTFTTDKGIHVSFPPPAPGLGDRVTVVDHVWRCTVVPFTEVTAETLGHPHARLYFDLDTGAWLTFTAQLLPQSVSDPYQSRATRHPAPQEATRA